MSRPSTRRATSRRRRTSPSRSMRRRRRSRSTTRRTTTPTPRSTVSAPSTAPPIRSSAARPIPRSPDRRSRSWRRSICPTAALIRTIRVRGWFGYRPGERQLDRDDQPAELFDDRRRGPSKPSGRRQRNRGRHGDRSQPLQPDGECHRPRRQHRQHANRLCDRHPAGRHAAPRH